MSVDVSKVDVIIFDYGNTLIELGGDQIVMLNNELLALLTSMFGECNSDTFSTIRKRQILAPYDTDEFIENDRVGICNELIEELYDVIPSSSQIEQVLNLKHKIFVDIVDVPDFVMPLLNRLQEKYRLAFISNYPCSASIADSLAKNKLTDFFESIVVSGDIGRVKPHPEIFEKSLNELNLRAEQSLYVGDNWLADIQGAKRMGMQAVHTTQYVSYEQFEPYDGDYSPDAVINHLSELETILLYRKR